MSFLLASASAKSGSSVRENNTILGSLKKGTSSCRFCLHLCRPAVSFIDHTQICIQPKERALYCTTKASEGITQNAAQQ